jgi:hypothetical protein
VEAAHGPFQARQQPPPRRGDARRHDATVRRLATAASQPPFLQTVEETRAVQIPDR